MYEDYQLICEGECNPDIREYDQAIPALLASEFDRPLPVVATIAGWVRRLKHTTHIVVKNEVWETTRQCWFKDVVCAVCGHHRKF